MHRAYQPFTPTNNKLLRNRWDSSDFQFHRKMVDTAVPLIDNKPPKTFVHLQLKLKTLQIKEQRRAEDERNDRIHQEKLSNIRRRSSNTIDHWNDYQKKSLNKDKRQEKHLRLLYDNQAILRRLESKESYYKQSNLELHHRTQQKYLDIITKYPKDVQKKSSSKLKRVSTTGSTSEEAKKKSEAEEDDSKSSVDEQKADEAAVENENEEEAQNDTSENVE